MKAGFRHVATDTAVGPMLVAVGPSGITEVRLGSSVAELGSEFEAEIPESSADSALVPVAEGIAALPSGASFTLPFPVRLHGTPFQLKVWNGIGAIPRGKVVSYADLAREIGVPGAVRAVASACGANRVAILVPCHRVVRTGGGLGGYRWGIDRKELLLRAEATG